MQKLVEVHVLQVELHFWHPVLISLNESIPHEITHLFPVKKYPDKQFIHESGWPEQLLQPYPHDTQFPFRLILFDGHVDTHTPLLATPETQLIQ